MILPKAQYTASQSKAISRIALLFFLYGANILLIAAINISSLIPYFYFLLISIAIVETIYPLPLRRVLADYGLFAFLMLALYLFQYWASPQFIGLSGGFGIGTDDTRYFYYIADSYPEGFQYSHDVSQMRAYEHILKFIAIFPINHPLDILFINIIPLILIAPFTQEIAYRFTGDEGVARLSAKLIRFCPFLLSNSLILIRDGWTTMAFVGGLCFLTRANYFKCGAMLAVLFVLRVGSALLLISAMLILIPRLIMWRKADWTRLAYVLVIGVIMISLLIVSADVIFNYLLEKGFLGSFFFRSYFVSEFMTQAAAVTGNEESILLAIYRAPDHIRIPLGFIYFFMSPLFSLNQVIRMDVIAPRAIMQNLYAILFIVYIKYFIKGTIYALRTRKWDVLIIIAACLSMIFIISYSSIQIRHKTQALPLLYIIIAYGWSRQIYFGEVLGRIGSLSSFVIQFGRAVWRFL